MVNKLSADRFSLHLRAWRIKISCSESEARWIHASFYISLMFLAHICSNHRSVASFLRGSRVVALQSGHLSSLSIEMLHSLLPIASLAQSASTAFQKGLFFHGRPNGDQYGSPNKQISLRNNQINYFHNLKGLFS